MTSCEYSTRTEVHGLLYKLSPKNVPVTYIVPHMNDVTLQTP
jgi:hypothetical protein